MNQDKQNEEVHDIVLGIIHRLTRISHKLLNRSNTRPIYFHPSVTSTKCIKTNFQRQKKARSIAVTSNYLSIKNLKNIRPQSPTTVKTN